MNLMARLGYLLATSTGSSAVAQLREMFYLSRPTKRYMVAGSWLEDLTCS